MSSEDEVYYSEDDPASWDVFESHQPEVAALVSESDVFDAKLYTGNPDREKTGNVSTPEWKTFLNLIDLKSPSEKEPELSSSCYKAWFVVDEYLSAQDRSS